MVSWLLAQVDLLNPPLLSFHLANALRMPLLRRHHLLKLLDPPLRSLDLLELLELLRIPLCRHRLASLFSGPLGSRLPVVSASVCR